MRHSRLATLLIALLLLAVACGGEGADTGQPVDAGDATEAETDAENPATEDAEAAGEPYKVGCLTDLSGPTAATYGTTAEAFELYIKALNDRGGIDGHPVELVLEDDRIDAARNVSLATKMITQDEVVAIFCGSLSGIQPGTHQEASRAEVPLITGVSASPELAFPPAADYYYSIGDEFTILGEVGGQFLKEVADVGTAVCIAFESAGGRAFCEGAEAAAQQDDWSTSSIFIPPTATEFDTIAQQVVAAGPAVVVSASSGEQLPNIWAAIRREGFDGPLVQGAVSIRAEETVPAAVANSPGDAEHYVFGRYVFSTAPEAEPLREAAEEYGTQYTLSNNHVVGWVLGMLMEQALTECGFPCSGADLQGVLDEFEVDTGGLANGPITFTDENHYGPTFQQIHRYDAGSESFEPVGDPIEKPATPEFAGGS